MTGVYIVNKRIKNSDLDSSQNFPKKYTEEYDTVRFSYLNKDKKIQQNTINQPFSA